MRARIWPAILTAVLALYVWLVLTRGLALIRTGEVAGVLIGVAVTVFPALAIWFMAAEWRLALRVDRMAAELAAAEDLPVAAPPGTGGPGPAARAEFDRLKPLVEQDRQNWRNWYHIAFAYDAAGDRAAARRALRTSARLWVAAGKNRG